MERRSQPWLTGFATVLCLALLAGMSWADYLPAPPERFPEASAAFLYSDRSYGQLFGAVAIVLLLVAALGSKARAVAAGNEGVRETRIPQVLLLVAAVLGRKVGAVLGLAMLFALLAGTSLWRSSYTALTDTGFIAADVSGVAAHEEWSSLHHLELQCLTTVRRGSEGRHYRSVRAKLYLRFAGGRSVELTDMRTYRPFKMSVEQAYLRLEEIRAKHRAPIIWGEARLHQRFESGDRLIMQCVNVILDRFPAEKRATLTSMLRQGSSLRDRTSASYR